MVTNKIDYIALYSFLGASILCIAMETRLFVIKELQMDEFSSRVTFIIICLLLGALYFCFQYITNDFLLPIVEKNLSKKQQQPISKLVAKSIDYIEKEKAPITDYERCKQAAQQKRQQEQSKTLENVLNYAKQELALYITEDELEKLNGLISLFQCYNEDQCKQIITPVTINAKLKSKDLRHFGWNIGNQFNKTGIETATFLKKVFAEPLKNMEISSIERKLREGGTCIIEIKETL